MRGEALRLRQRGATQELQKADKALKDLRVMRDRKDPLAAADVVCVCVRVCCVCVVRVCVRIYVATSELHHARSQGPASCG